MFRADYEFEIIDHPTLGRIIIIEDLDQGSTSVTNDMENVLRDIMHLEGVDIEHCKITYKDSMGNWDEVQVSRKGGIGFVSHQQAKTYQRVIDRWMQQHKTEQQ